MLFLNTMLFHKLKLAEVTPVFKKEDELFKENYLPVSVPFKASTTFEGITFNRIA